MKTKLILLLTFMVGIAQASSIAWGVGAKAFGTSDGTKERAANYYVAIFLYEDYADVMSAISSLGTDAATATSTLSSLEKSSGVTKATGQASGSFESTLPSITTVSLFAVAFDATTIGAAENYLVSGEVLSDAYASPDNPTNTGTFSASSFSGNSWTAVAVPEPSTAALALAGLALLLKRRKA